MTIKGNQPPTNKNCSPEDCPCRGGNSLNRRRRSLLKFALLAATFSPFYALAARKPEKMRPQPGDQLVFAFGDQEGQLIQGADIKLDSAPVAAYPKDLAGNIVRNRSRLNMVLVMRLSPESLNDTLKQNAADGLVAYSAICTHTGCIVEGWSEDKKQMICPCHGSTYDAANSANVVKGPAPKPLAILPLTVKTGSIEVAGKFSRKVGFQQQRY
ncbi:MAG: hypothetical protein DRR42_02160 [Gammaproteobacteria bacterium]|nr:MAG: hypothetical protein DRR42_02160 [Gammaproteobacteria bacterium]